HHDHSLSVLLLLWPLVRAPTCKFCSPPMTSDRPTLTEWKLTETRNVSGSACTTSVQSEIGLLGCHRLIDRLIVSRVQFLFRFEDGVV
ncbi:hypothetical protein EV424DRAFT_1467736, partial [Suillus variegatus]